MSTAKRLSLTLLLLLTLPLRALCAPEGWAALLEPSELASILAQTSELRILHVSGNFSRGHLPGAIETSYSDWRGPATSPGELPELSALTTLLQGLGINSNTPVVVVHEGSNPADMGTATRVYWTLKSLGVVDLAVLNGGFNAWRAAGLPVSTATEVLAASTFTPQWLDDWRVRTADVEQLVSSGEAQLIDARPPIFFAGFRATLGRPGTIAGADNLQYESWFDGTRLKSRDALVAVQNAFSSVPAPVTVSFCNTGHWASVNWFVMSEVIGIANVRLYAESITEWSQADRPMDNQPNRSQIYRDMTVRWLKDLLGA